MPSRITDMSLSHYSSPSALSSAPGEKAGHGRRRRPDMPPEALDELTNMLWMPPSVNIANPEQSWLKDQEFQIKELDESVRRPHNIFHRLTAHYDNRRHPSKVAHLCYSHRDLDPRLIRRIMLLFAQELTQRTDRFRKWRARTAFTDRLNAWLDRMDAATALWIGQDAFRAVFGYNRTTPVVTVESGCEACIISVIGGNPQLLVDLRANLRARRTFYPRRGRTEPRLRPFVESWIRQFDDETAKAICNLSDALSEDISALNTEIEKRKEESAKRRADAGKLPRQTWRRQPRRKRKDKVLPEPRLPAMTRWTQYSSLPGYASDGEVPVQEEPVSVYYELPATTIAQDNGGGNLQDDYYDDGDSTGNETWDWFDDQMRGRGLTPQDRRQALRNVHPAFSEYGPESAGMPPLDPDAVSSVTSEASSWVTITVHTEESEVAMAVDRLDLSGVRPMWQTEEPEWECESQYTSPEQRRDPSSTWSEVDGAGAYIAARKDWNNPRRTKPQDPVPPPPASSVYSSHPGFRRSYDLESL
ncbi:hypothetical protein EDB80DRAFT_675367 [Ilyonectria destructans]|nr:hypothetical protein EDB80DRAFT_675367 [Ilyonectria destructans]